MMKIISDSTETYITTLLINATYVKEIYSVPIPTMEVYGKDGGQ